MSCSSCGTNDKSPGGCKNNGLCSTGGCNKLNVYDWLGGMQLPPGHKPFGIVEVRFKGSRKEFYRNPNNVELFIGDPVVVDAESGYDIGHVSLKGELVKLQLKKYNISESDDRLHNIQKLARDYELTRYKDAKKEEAKTLQRARTMALEMGLQMKLSDIEFQGDRRKVTFFYTSEDRVDFRALIKRYADEFKTRIEMRQIGYRQEAARLGGIGSCGRELCCSTWLTDFKQVNVGAARYQNLSLNPLKLQGQCGRLKCCLNYELDTYMEAISEFPRDPDKVRLETEIGTAKALKTDILKRMMWFAYTDKIGGDWIALKVDDVNRILAMNRNGEKPARLTELDKTGIIEKPKFATVEMEGSLTRMEGKRPPSSQNRNNKGGGNRNNRKDGGGGNPNKPKGGTDPKPN